MRPRRVVTLPPAFALPAGTLLAQQIVVREAVDAVLAGAGTKDHLDTLTAELAVAIELRRLAIARPRHHLVPREQLVALSEPLAAAVDAVASVKARHTEAGRVGCNHDQRQGLLGLADIVDQMRDALPRSLWLMAIRTTLDRIKCHAN